MFGVNKYGQDTLAPQFTPQKPKSGTFPKPNSPHERSIIYSLELYRLLNHRRAMLRQEVLSHMFAEGLLSVPGPFVADARSLLVLQRLEQRDAMDHSYRQTVRILSDAHCRIEFEPSDSIDAWSREHYRKQMEDALSDSHPQVLDLALRLANRAGVFDRFSEKIERSVEALARQKAGINCEAQLEDTMSHLRHCYAAVFSTANFL